MTNRYAKHWPAITYATLVIIAVVAAFTTQEWAISWCILTAFFLFVGRGIFALRSDKWVAKQHYISTDGTRFWSRGNAIATVVVFGVVAGLMATLASALLPAEGRFIPFIGELLSVYVGVALARLFPRLLLRKDTVVGSHQTQATTFTDPAG